VQFEGSVNTTAALESSGNPTTHERNPVSNIDGRYLNDTAAAEHLADIKLLSGIADMCNKYCIVH